MPAGGAPGSDHEPKDEKRGGVEGEDRPDPGSCDQHAGDRRANGPRQVDVDRAEGGGGGELRARNEIGEQRLVGRHREGRPGAEHKRECQQEGRRHLSGDRQDGERQPRDDQTPLDNHEKPTPIEGIGQDTADVREQHVRHQIRRLDQRDQERGVRLVDQQPLAPTVCIQEPMLLTRTASHSARKIPTRSGAQIESALLAVLIIPPRSILIPYR